MKTAIYEITVERTFAAAHAIRLPDGSLEPMHGHNWRVRATVAAERLDGIETVMDFHDLQSLLDGATDGFHNRSLNEVAPFADGEGGLAINPTAERVAAWIGERIDRKLPDRVRLVCVEVTEAAGCVARFRIDR